MDIRIDGEALDYTDTYNDNDLENFGLRRYREYVTGRAKAVDRNENSSLTAKYRGAGHSMNEKSTVTCLYDGVTCYSVKVMPTVSGISANAGHAEGGQTLTISGTSLDGETVSVTVDGEPCTVDDSSISKT